MERDGVGAVVMERLVERNWVEWQWRNEERSLTKKKREKRSSRPHANDREKRLRKLRERRESLSTTDRGVGGSLLKIFIGRRG